MAKYHNRDNGEPGICIAKPGNCKYNISEDEHFSNKQDAREAYEKNNAENTFSKMAKVGTSPKQKFVDNALTSNLEYTGKNPKWMNALHKQANTMYPDSPEPKIIDVIDSPVGKLAVVWSENSLNKNDTMPQTRGFKLHETSLVNMKTGEKLGYVKTEYVDEESAIRTFKNDSWSSLRYMEEYSGSSFGIKEYVDLPQKKGDTDRPKYKKVLTIDEAKTPEEMIEAKRKIWAAAHKSLKINPTSMKNDRVELYNLNKDHSPTDEATLDKDLKQIKKITDKKYANFKKDYENPFVGYSRAEEEIQGTGLGSSMYIYTARMLGKKNKIFRGSGIQTDFAVNVWERFTKNEKIPAAKMTQKYSDSEDSECYYLDFRDKE